MQEELKMAESNSGRGSMVNSVATAEAETDKSMYTKYSNKGH